MPKLIEIFRPGRHQAMSGESLSFTEADLARSAAAYDPALHEAPICVGHPAHDAPAYGWVGKLAFAEGALVAEPRQVDPAFAELVAAGRYKKVSAAFYKPDSPSNPKPGVYYLRHVGFLGAQPPSVKGLKPAQFAGTAEDVIVFGDWNDQATVRLFRRIRDFLIEKFGQDEAERALPADTLDYLADDAAQPEESDMNDPAYAERQRQLAIREQALASRESKVTEKEKAVGAKEALFTEAELRRRAQANGTFLDQLAAEGRILPAWRPGLLAFMERLRGSEAIIFGEGEERDEIDPVEAFKEFLGVLPQQVSFAEVARAPIARAGGSARPLVTPPGFHVDPDELELRDRALAYAEEHKMDFLEAVRRLEAAGA